MEKDKTEKEGSEGWRRGLFATLNTEIRKGLIEQVMAEQRLGAKRGPCGCLGEEHSKQRGQQLPSPLGTEMLKIISETGARWARMRMMERKSERWWHCGW